MPDDGLMGPRSDQPKRRTFTAEYKLAMIVEYDAASEPGAKGALLRREGLYSSHIVEWRRARDAGALAGLAPPPGRPAPHPRDAQIAALQKEKARLGQGAGKGRLAGGGPAKLQAPLGAPPRSAGTH